jgi:ribonuclease HII
MTEKQLAKQLEKEAKAAEKLKKEIERTESLMIYERKFADKGYIAGIDEVGRGPLSGPVVACACILPADHRILHLNDSKKLSEKKREELYDVIMNEAVAVGLGMVPPKRIDEINILEATRKAMRCAAASVPADVFMIDAVTGLGLNGREVPIIKGDATSYAIAAASIVAKVTRDRQMIELDRQYPEYGFARNKGYGTKEHIEALKRIGPCPVHRRSFIGHFV